MIDGQAKEFESETKLLPQAAAEQLQEETAAPVNGKTELSLRQLRINQIYRKKKLRRGTRAKSSGII